MLAALSNRRFVAYLLTAALADGGYWVAVVAQGWLVVQLTNSPFWLGAVASVAQLPYLLFSIAGGDLADRFERRIVVAINNALIAMLSVCTALLVARGAITVWWLLGLGFTVGTINALEHPVDRAWLYDLVRGRELGSSIALSSLEWALARTVGPAIGGAAIATIGIAAGYGAYAAATIPIALLALALRSSRDRRAAAATGATEPKKLHAIVVFSIFTAVFTIGVSPYQTLLPGIARNEFGADARLYGLMAAGGGVGAVLAALVLSVRGELRRKGRIAVVASFAGAALLVIFTRVHTLVLAVPLLAAMGAVDTLMYALANTYVQECAGDAERGRANAIFSVAFLGGFPIGSFALGTLAERFGTSATLAVSGLAVCAAAVMFWCAAPLARDAA